jgi:hypothetical protein
LERKFIALFLFCSAALPDPSRDSTIKAYFTRINAEDFPQSSLGHHHTVLGHNLIITARHCVVSFRASNQKIYREQLKNPPKDGTKQLEYTPQDPNWRMHAPDERAFKIEYFKAALEKEREKGQLVSSTTCRRPGSGVKRLTVTLGQDNPGDHRARNHGALVK